MVPQGREQITTKTDISGNYFFKGGGAFHYSTHSGWFSRYALSPYITKNSKEFVFLEFLSASIGSTPAVSPLNLRARASPQTGDARARLYFSHRLRFQSPLRR